MLTGAILGSPCGIQFANFDLADVKFVTAILAAPVANRVADRGPWRRRLRYPGTSSSDPRRVDDCRERLNREERRLARYTGLVLFTGALIDLRWVRK